MKLTPKMEIEFISTYFIENCITLKYCNKSVHGNSRQWRRMDEDWDKIH